MVGVLAIIVGVLAVIMIATSYAFYKQKKVPLSWTLFWSGLWTLGAGVVIFSGYANTLSQQLIGTQANLVVVYFAILLLFLLVFRNYIQNKKTQQEISQLVEEIAKRNSK
ncbi:MAG: DUF2304 family protein [Candidatus Woesearchaeota archaeon]